MHEEKNPAQHRAHEAVFRQQFQIIVMHVDRIVLHFQKAKLASVVKISAAARTGDGMQLILHQGRFPKKQPRILRFVDLPKPGEKRLALRHKKEPASDDEDSPC